MKTEIDREIDARFMEMAKNVSKSSADPSTKTGCVLVDHHENVWGVGYNAFPHGVIVSDERLNDRPIKYAMTVHAEVNAILDAQARVRYGTAYVYPWPPCSQCAGLLINAGIARIVAPEPTEEQKERWGDSFNIMYTMLEEAGVELDLWT